MIHFIWSLLGQKYGSWLCWFFFCEVTFPRAVNFLFPSLFAESLTWNNNVHMGSSLAFLWINCNYSVLYMEVFYFLIPFFKSTRSIPHSQWQVLFTLILCNRTQGKVYYWSWFCMSLSINFHICKWHGWAHLCRRARISIFFLSTEATSELSTQSFFISHSI